MVHNGSRPGTESGSNAVEASVEDRKLTEALVAYLGKGRSSFPRADDDAVAALAGGEHPSALLAHVRAITEEMRSMETDWATATLSEGGRAAQQVIAARHPELGHEALEALYWMFTYDRR